MLHFPSKLSANGPNGIPRRSDSLNLNATQQKRASHPIFLQVEEELHDARRVQADGQEDDLRSALTMVISRVSELSNLLSEAYKTQADLEVQLNVAKSNLKLVIANNEMLEDALKRDNSGQSKDIGWRRTSGRDDNRNSRPPPERAQSVDYTPALSDPSPPPSASTPPPPTQNQDNRFFKFRFSASNPSSSRPTSRPETPSGNASPHLPGIPAHHLTSPSMPSLSTARTKEIEELTAELEKEKTAKKAIAEQKTALEAELESLSQALFEEANKMVADERKRRAETEEELKELRLEKEALKSALRLIDGENSHLRESSLSNSPRGNESFSNSRTHSRSSSEVGVKSRPNSFSLPSYPPLPPSPAPSDVVHIVDETAPNDRKRDSLHLNVVSPAEEESQPTPRFRTSDMPPDTSQTDIFMEASPWADVPSKSASNSPSPHPPSTSPSILSSVTYISMR